MATELNESFRSLTMANKTSRDESQSDLEEIAVDDTLTDARFRQNFEVMRYSGEMCDVEIVVEEVKFKGDFILKVQYFVRDYC